MIHLSNRNKIRTSGLLVGLLSLAACSTTPPGTIQGALTGIGSNAAQGSVSAWGLAWGEAVKGASVSYSPDGTAPGLKAFQDGQAHFAVGSSPLPDDVAASVRGMCTADGAVSFAAGVLPVGVAIKIKDVSDVVLDAPVLAGILEGRITRWNDPRLLELNPETDLPDLGITVLVPEGPSDTVRPVNDYLGRDAGMDWTPATPDSLPSTVLGQVSSPPLDLANKLDDTDGGLSILDGSIIGNRFTAAQLVFDGKPRRLQATSVVDAVSTGTVQSSARSVVQGLDGRSGYALATVIYVYVCRQYEEPELGRLTQSMAESVLSEEAQKNANAFAFVMSPGKKAIADARRLISTVGGGQ
ncbi:substrate-binding domain-containing protein [Arthrobacter sp. G.S.26]|uniref:substrate-binding domain-containing protein n=1 Tax=Arthrobacter sp. G.S.26 TaxID=3433706 RepID=UPI003D78426C